MTIASTTTPVKQYAGNGVTTAFSTVFTFNLASDLIVTVTSSSGVDTVKTITTHYTVSGGAGSTGTVTMLTAPASGETLTIQRSTPLTQSVDYVENDAFPAAVHEAALDKLTYIVQELEENLDRAFTVSATSGVTDLEIPAVAEAFVRWNSTADALESVTLVDFDAVSFSGTGLLANDGTSALLGRTLTGTTNEISVTNGSGVSGNPTVGLASTVDLTGKTVKLKDSTLTIEDDSDATKKVALQCSGITTGTTRTLTVPNASGTIALTSDVPPVGAQYVTLATDATLTSERVLTAGTGISISDGGAGGNVTISQAAGAVLQVVSTHVTATTTSTSTSFADISGMTVDITPSSSSNKVLVIVNLSIASDTANTLGIRIDRAGTAIGSGVAAGSRFETGRQVYVNDGTSIQGTTMVYLDSPSTTSSTTYKVQWICNTAGTNYLNRSRTDTNAATFARASSSITVMEIKG